MTKKYYCKVCEDSFWAGEDRRIDLREHSWQHLGTALDNFADDMISEIEE